MRDAVAAALARIGFTEPRLSTRPADRASGEFRRVVVVLDGPNPTYDYYLASRLRAAGIEVSAFELGKPGAVAPGALDDALLIFCRYVSPPWLDHVERARRARIALFLDDDMVRLLRDSSTPAKYRSRLWRLSLSQWPRLSRALDIVIASTDVLAGRLGGDAKVRTIGPLADDQDLAPPATHRSQRTVAFHATGVHVREHRFLAPVVAAVHAARPEVEVEVIANKACRRYWGRAPAVRFAPQQPWPEYRRRTAETGIALMLAPLSPDLGNAARAPVKRIDAARAGAALLVSEAGIYEVSEAEKALGMLVPWRQQDWIDAVTALIDDPERCGRLAALNRERLVAARAGAPPFIEVGERSGFWRLAQEAPSA